MGTGLVERPEWGLRIRLQGNLSIDERDELAREIERQARELAQVGREWSSLIVLDRFQADRFRPEVVVNLMRLGRMCGHVRSAVVMTDWHWACTFADAMIAAGTDDQVRIFVVGTVGEEDCAAAMAWILTGMAATLVTRAA